MSGTEPVQISRTVPNREAQRYGTIVVVGGGCYGSYYVRQLGRGAKAGAIQWDRLLVVDRDPACKVAVSEADRIRRVLDFGGGPPHSEITTTDPRDRHHSPAPTTIRPPKLIVAEWTDFFADYLANAVSHPDASAHDAIVPSPLMPHLLLEWLMGRARVRWPDREIGLRPLARDPAIPWQMALPSAIHVVSFAEWTCPVNCIEPRTCPATRGPRTWSMPVAVTDYVNDERERGEQIIGPVIFHCSHRTHGVGMVDVSDVVHADATVTSAGTIPGAAVLVGTVSHCHGALGLLGLGRAA